VLPKQRKSKVDAGKKKTNNFILKKVARFQVTGDTSLQTVIAGEETKSYFFVIEINLSESREEKMISKTSRLECCSRKFSSETASFQVGRTNSIGNSCGTSSKRPVSEIIFPSGLINCH
jgi:hypothetical protein